MFGRGGRGGGGGGSRQVCHFFLEGRCRFGGMLFQILIFLVANTDTTTDNCKNEHPAGQGSSQSHGGFGGNRFAALGNNNNNQGAGNRSGAFGSSTFAPSFLLFAMVGSLVARQDTFISALLDTFTSTIALQHIGPRLSTPRTPLLSSHRITLSCSHSIPLRLKSLLNSHLRQ